MERAQFAPVSDQTELPEYIGVMNQRLQRMAEMLARLQAFRYRQVTSATTLTQGDDSLDVNTTTGNVTVTLPPAASCPGKQFHVKKTSVANTLTLDAAGSDTIDGAGSVGWTTNGQSLLVESVLTAAPATYSWRIR